MIESLRTDLGDDDDNDVCQMSKLTGWWPNIEHMQDGSCLSLTHGSDVVGTLTSTRSQNNVPPRSAYTKLNSLLRDQGSSQWIDPSNRTGLEERVQFDLEVIISRSWSAATRSELLAGLVIGV